MKAVNKLQEARIVVLGKPGSGKTYQSKRIAEEYGLKYVSTGDIFRDIATGNTRLGEEIRESMKTGELFSDNLVQNVLDEALPQKGFVLDGCPRKLSQIGFVKSVDCVIYVDVSDKEVIHRILSRGQNRLDDNYKSVNTRLKVFSEETALLIEYYEKKGLLIQVNGEQSQEDVHKEMIRRLESRFCN